MKLILTFYSSQAFENQKVVFANNNDLFKEISGFIPIVLLQVYLYNLYKTIHIKSIDYLRLSIEFLDLTLKFMILFSLINSNERRRGIFYVSPNRAQYKMISRCLFFQKNDSIALLNRDLILLVGIFLISQLLLSENHLLYLKISLVFWICLIYFKKYNFSLNFERNLDNSKKLANDPIFLFSFILLASISSSGLIWNIIFFIFILFQITENHQKYKENQVEVFILEICIAKLLYLHVAKLFFKLTSFLLSKLFSVLIILLLLYSYNTISNNPKALSLQN